MNKLEQIEKLRERANVSYDEAKIAYEKSDGDLLDAIIYLERQGKVKAPAEDGYYNSKQSHTPEPEANESDGFKDTLERVGKFFVDLLHKGNTTFFEVVKTDESLIKFPVTVFVLLLLFAPWVTIPLMIVGLFFNLKYRFIGSENDA